MWTRIRRRDQLYYNLVKGNYLNPYKRDTGILKKLQGALLDISNSSQLYGGKNKNRDSGKKNDSRMGNLPNLQDDPESKANIRWLVEIRNVYTSYQSVASAWEHGRRRQAYLMAPELVEVRYTGAI